MHLKAGAYYLVLGTGSARKWVRLGDERHKAYAEYARLIPSLEVSGNTFANVAANVVQAHWGTLAERTRQDYNRALERLLKAFRDAPIDQITTGDVGRYLDLRTSKNDANREQSVLSLIFRFAIRWDMIKENPARKLSYFERPTRQRIITHSEWRAIRLAALDPIPVFMDLAYVTGLRVGDIRKLTWANVTPDGLYVRQGKNKVEGVYTLTPGLLAVLEAAKRLHGMKGIARLPHTAIIHTQKMKPYTYAGIRSAWDRACARAEVKGCRIHDIRRTAITHAKQQGRKAQDFSLHKTEAQASAYVVEVPKVVPLEVLK